ncbi:DUF4168 domain-containing protein [Pleomorphovibrio marinus]|uniref:DUF4168 domain-containing protein n=1 Tax=Pleomorphovibrio marinus TaxID=2164132 RepID=UPI001E4F2243|nr:DUF4168 domain-containing protein [Pleomorphovibrio marinus]
MKLNYNVLDVMSYSKLSKVFSFSILLSFCFAFGVMAQQLPNPQQQQVNDEFSDDEYEKFVKINMEMIPLQEQAQQKMMNAIEEHGIDVERFQMLAQAQQSGNITDVSEDPEEIAKFNEAGQEVMKVQEETNQEMQKTIAENDMDVQKFQEMSVAYNQSPKVKEKIDSMIGDLE